MARVKWESANISHKRFVEHQQASAGWKSIRVKRMPPWRAELGEKSCEMNNIVYFIPFNFQLNLNKIDR
jgi:hypothetical protein